MRYLKEGEACSVIERLLVKKNYLYFDGLRRAFSIREADS